ncbi:MAG: DUF378 domain-containing protein [Clostridia bacterium]|nr:DUF378 domain-containing protein [Clostridia bacterium]MDD4686144.1 DUF378 domain-containing protein [Clostridia bacterium]
MLTFISFIIIMIGSLNWFFIGAFQYDFVAGFFGSQASLLSRFVYFIIGMAAFVMLAMALKSKGKIKLTENVFKQKNVKKNGEKRQINKSNDKQENYNQEQNEINYKANIDNSNRKKTNNIDYKSENGKERERESETYGFKDFDVTQYDE